MVTIAETTLVEGETSYLKDVRAPEFQPKASKFSDLILDFCRRLSHCPEHYQRDLCLALTTAMLQGSENLRLPKPTVMEAYARGRAGGRIARYTKGIIDHGLREAESVGPTGVSPYYDIQMRSGSDGQKPINYKEGIILATTLKHAIDSMTCAGRGVPATRLELNKLLGEISNRERAYRPSGMDPYDSDPCRKTEKELESISYKIWENFRSSACCSTPEEGLKAAKTVRGAVSILAAMAEPYPRSVDFPSLQDILKELYSLVKAKR